MFSIIKAAFSENDGTPSASRLLSAVCTLASISWVSFVLATSHPHALPDAMTLGGTTAFSIAHYTVNKMSGGAKTL